METKELELALDIKSTTDKICPDILSLTHTNEKD